MSTDTELTPEEAQIVRFYLRSAFRGTEVPCHDDPRVGSALRKLTLRAREAGLPMGEDAFRAWMDERRLARVRSLDVRL
jgi:hypothetical protein